MKKHKQNFNRLFSICAFILTAGYVHSQCTVPTSVTATPSIICVGATTSLNATSAGNSISWYTVAVGGVPLGSSASGANYSIVPAVTTQYFAESFMVAGGTTYTYTGAMQQVTVPVGVTSITIQVRGAQGTAGSSPAGNGGYASGVMNVTPGQVLSLYVGGQAGFNGGGTGVAPGGNGGGASDVRVAPGTLADRVIVAGAGGGGGATNTQGNGGAGGGGTAGANYVGGAGGLGANLLGPPVGGTNGGLNGGNGGVGNGSNNGGAGGGGGFNNGGIGGTNAGYLAGLNGTLGIGGNAGGPTGPGGGGGGYFGGGGASGGLNSNAGGGGGSSFTGTLTSPSFSPGVQVGNGQIVILGFNVGCVSVARTPVTVTVNPSPTITVAGPTIACLGGTINLTANGANTYSWNNGAITSTIAVSPSVNTTYSVIGTSSAGCTGTVSQIITVSANPTVAITGGTAAVCAGSAINLTASGANTYSWSNGAATSTIAPTPTANASYTVVGTNTAGCTNSAVKAVTVTAAPSVSVAGASTICIGQTTILTASGADTYSWNTGSTSSSIAVTPTTTATYTAYGTSTVTGCTGNITTNVVVSPCTGLNSKSVSLSGLSVYPNPSNGEFIVELNNGLNKIIEVTDLTGRLVLTNTSSKDKVNVSMANLANGVYYLKIQSNNAVEVIKVVKQ